MSIASVSYGWTLLSRAFSRSIPRQTAATLALQWASRSASKSVDFVSNTTTSNSPTDRSVFEDESEDYAEIACHAPPKRLPTMNLIETNLPPRLPEPVVSDMSIFEDSTTSRSDYAAVAVCLREPPSSTFQTLTNLINDKQYEEAWALCQEMIKSGIEIPRSDLYGLAAMDALASSELSEEDKLSRCSLWLTMFPCARESRGAADLHIRFMRRRVFRVLQPTMTLAVNFSLIMASKGYAESISPEAPLFVTRFASTPVSLRFIKAFLDTDLSYIADVNSEGDESGEETRDAKRLRRLQELAYCVQRPAIENLARSGEFEAAMSLLPTSKNPFRLPTTTYDFLFSRLRHAPERHPDYIKLVEKLRLDPLYYFDMPESPSNVPLEDLNLKLKNVKALGKELDPKSPVYMGKALAVQLQSILEHLNQSELSIPQVMNFFSDYLETGRTTAIYRLRNLALGVTWPLGNNFLYAEMSYYLNNNLYLLVLQTYANYFYFCGVPEEEITAAIDRLNGTDRSHPAYLVRRPTSLRKRVPTESHADLAWHALARAAPAGRAISDLYRRFVMYQLRIRDDNTPKDTTRLCFPASITKPIGSSVFTVFISRVLDFREPSRASEVLRDMQKLGITPTIHHYTLLATFFACAGHAQHAFSIIRWIEEAHPAEFPTPMRMSPERVHSHPESGIPVPDVIFYTSLLAAFTRLRHLEEAQEIRRLFYDRFIYTLSSHKPLDYALTILQWLENELKKGRVLTRLKVLPPPHHSRATHAISFESFDK